MSKMEKRLARLQQRHDENSRIMARLKHGQTRWGGRMNFPRSSINLSRGMILDTRGIKGARLNHMYSQKR